MFMCIIAYMCVFVFIFKMCKLWLGKYEALAVKAKASVEPSLKNGVQFPRVDVQSGGLGAERQPRSSCLR